MEIIYLVIGAVIGAVVSCLIFKGRSSAIAALLEDEKRRHDADNEKLETLANRHAAEVKAAVESERELSQKLIKEAKDEAENRLAAAKAEADKRLDAAKSEADKRVEDIKRETEDRIAKIKAESVSQRDKELDALRKSYEHQIALFKEQVTTITENMLKTRSDQLQQANTQRMDEMFKPIKENISRMEQSITETREANARNSASFEKTIQQMMKSNSTLCDQAERLSTALLRKNKTVGNWGELILSELLESQGLKPGVHFDVQQSLKDETGAAMLNDETGSRMIPDVVLHLADKRDVVVDSKMSLVAYYDYQNADNEAEKREALKRHIESIRAHLKGLSVKKYSSYISNGHSTIDFVIMFVPIEGALMLAMSECPELWREAFDKKVFIAGGQTLIAALHIIDLTWVNVKQQRNTNLIMDEARKMLDRVNSFYGEFQAVGRKLDEVAKAYGAVSKRVAEGPQSLLATGRRMEELGARGKKALPSTADDTGSDMHDVNTEAAD